VGEGNICDLCKQDGEFVEAIAWYTADDGKDYDVCKKHAEHVKKAGIELHIYTEEI